MRIPVFVSCPTLLSPAQEASRKVVIGILQDLQLEPRALGRSDYPSEYPLREVWAIARHCSGGVILGFEQCLASQGTWKRGTPEERVFDSDDPAAFPSPWNQLEAGILFGLRLPLLIFREPSVRGGVFDPGVTDLFIHSMPPPDASAGKMASLKEVFLKWHSKVSQHYFAT
ncbi:MAG: hypothetical protein U0821_17165 [Chloroflexota bacterium]